MEFDYTQLQGPWWIFVSNLPYNIGTRLLVKLITEVPVIHRYVVMVQKEVGDRIVANPGGKEYGLYQSYLNCLLNLRFNLMFQKIVFIQNQK